MRLLWRPYLVLGAIMVMMSTPSLADHHHCSSSRSHLQNSNAAGESHDEDSEHCNSDHGAYDKENNHTHVHKPRGVSHHHYGIGLTLLAVNVSSAFLPVVLRKKQPNTDNVIFFVSTCFAGGSLLGLSAFHLLPEALVLLDHAGVGVTVKESFVNAAFPCWVIGFLVLFYFDKLMHAMNVEHHHAFGDPCTAVHDAHHDRRRAAYEGNAKHVHDSAFHALDMEDIEEIYDTTLGEQNPLCRTATNHHHHSHEDSTSLLPVLVGLAAMGLHSFLECLAIGVSPTTHLMWISASCIITHEWATVMIMSDTLIQKNLSTVSLVLCIAMLCFAAPAGVITGGLVGSSANLSIFGIVNALAAGVVLYVGMEILFSLFESKSARGVRRFHVGILTVVVGCALMFSVMLLHVATHVH